MLIQQKFCSYIALYAETWKQLGVFGEQSSAYRRIRSGWACAGRAGEAPASRADWRHGE
ncbi:hypothetical protein BOS5A_110482 [Bosea sp. EC-HK365B]|nr:hypothetical protein BOSE7B_40989 [Bosea sp. 7B]VVT51885.1 hypothetical protein BOS5A_110482 [Bosea sp. EC-HK365B]VXC87714.1 hypothetical protein BOSE127_70033 [Bosea sp. 127]